MRVGTLESRRIEAHEARDSPTRRRRMVARPASGRDPQPELAASRMTSGPRANRRWSSGRGAITPSPARDGSPPGLAGERLRRSRPLRLPREGAKRRPGAARRPDRRPARPVSRASELGPPAQDPSREDATHAERVGHGRQSDLPRLRAGHRPAGGDGSRPPTGPRRQRLPPPPPMLESVGGGHAGPRAEAGVRPVDSRSARAPNPGGALRAARALLPLDP